VCVYVREREKDRRSACILHESAPPSEVSRASECATPLLPARAFGLSRLCGTSARPWRASAVGPAFSRLLRDETKYECVDKVREEERENREARKKKTKNHFAGTKSTGRERER
jgi:hypothetical protein